MTVLRAAAVLACIALATAATAASHGIGGRGDLPISKELYIWGAALAVAVHNRGAVIPPERLDGIFLIIVALIYLVMSQNPARYLGIIPVILLGKAASVIFYSAYVFLGGQSKSFLIFAGLDFIMFWLHLWALGPNGLARIRAALDTSTTRAPLSRSVCRWSAVVLVV
mgnify:CR=1 FL=1